MLLYRLYQLTEWLPDLMLLVLWAASFMRWRRDRSRAGLLQFIGGTILGLSVVVGFLLFNRFFGPARSSLSEVTKDGTYVFQTKLYWIRYWLRPAVTTIAWSLFTVGYLLSKVKGSPASSQGDE